MDNPILLIMALTPGIIGIATSKLLDGDTSPEPIDKGIIKYFLYSASALLITELIGFLIEFSASLKNPDLIIESVHPLQKALTQNNNFTFWDIILPSLLAVIIALSWKLYLKDKIICLANKLLLYFGKNAIALPSYELESLLADGKGHFLEVHFPNGRIVTGMLHEYNIATNTIRLRPLPDWITDNDVARYEKDTIAILDTGIVIKEFDYQYIELKN